MSDAILQEAMAGLTKAVTVLTEQNAIQKDLTSSTPSTPYVRGPGGLMGVLGAEREMFATHMTPMGLADAIPSQGSVDMTPIFPYITGFTTSTDSEKDGVCDDPQEAGNMKTCYQTAQFGRKEYATRVLEINRVGQRINRGEFTDQRLVNSPLVNQLGGLLRQNFGIPNQTAAVGGREMLMRILEVGVEYQRWFAEKIYTGSPDNNSDGGGFKEFPGLETLVGTNKVDAFTGQNCPSLDSDLKDMNYDRVDDVNAANNIVNVLTYAYRTRRHKATHHNMGVVDFRFVMRETLFYELTAVWPCNYMTYRCAFPNAEGVLNLDANDAIAMRDSMRNGSYLTIDGRQVPVILDDAQTEQSNSTTSNLNSGEFASDIYLLPFSVRNGTVKTLFWEYFDYNQGTMQAAADAQASQWFWTDGGRFMWGVKPPNNWCVQLISKIEPRLILKTPHLAARISNVAYAPLQHTDDPLPSQEYFVNGGVSTDRGPAVSPYSDWNLPA